MLTLIVLPPCHFTFILSWLLIAYYLILFYSFLNLSLFNISTRQWTPRFRTVKDRTVKLAPSASLSSTESLKKLQIYNFYF